MLLILGCVATSELALLLPEEPVSGPQLLYVSGEADALSLYVDGERLAQGEGPLLGVSWEGSEGTHLVRGEGRWEDQIQAVYGTVVVQPGAGDQVSPKVSFRFPADGAVLAPPLRVELAVDQEIAAAIVQVDGQDIAELPPEGPWELLIDSIGPGPHTVAALATDHAGNEGRAQISIRVTE